MRKQITDPAIIKLRAERGLCMRLAKRLDLSPQAVHQWRRVPTEHLRVVSDMTGLSPAFMRPDLYELMVDEPLDR
jgi:hypothetical protein